jgi:hypothetical protein
MPPRRRPWRTGRREGAASTTEAWAASRSPRHATGRPAMLDDYRPAGPRPRHRRPASVRPPSTLVAAVLRPTPNVPGVASVPATGRFRLRGPQVVPRPRGRRLGGRRRVRRHGRGALVRHGGRPRRDGPLERRVRLRVLPPRRSSCQVTTPARRNEGPPARPSPWVPSSSTPGPRRVRDQRRGPGGGRRRAVTAIRRERRAAGGIQGGGASPEVPDTIKWSPVAAAVGPCGACPCRPQLCSTRDGESLADTERFSLGDRTPT